MTRAKNLNLQEQRYETAASPAIRRAPKGAPGVGRLHLCGKPILVGEGAPNGNGEWHRAHNRLAKEDKSLEQPVYYRYHFLGKHVRPAKSAADLLWRARRGIDEGVWRRAGDRWLLYNDIGTLDQAITLVEAREGSLTTTSTEEGGDADGCEA